MFNYKIDRVVSEFAGFISRDIEGYSKVTYSRDRLRNRSRGGHRNKVVGRGYSLLRLMCTTASKSGLF